MNLCLSPMMHDLYYDGAGFNENLNDVSSLSLYYLKSFQTSLIEKRGLSHCLFGACVNTFWVHVTTWKLHTIVI